MTTTMVMLVAVAVNNNNNNGDDCGCCQAMSDLVEQLWDQTPSDRDDDFVKKNGHETTFSAVNIGPTGSDDYVYDDDVLMLMC